MNQQNTHILTLIKLREGHLSDAEGLSVREQLASDSLLLQHWKSLSQLYEQKISPGEPETQNNTEIDAESVAAFVEERMNPDQRRKFESECWNHLNSLREVISAYQAIHAGVSPNRISEQNTISSAQVVQRMNDVIKSECQMVDSLPMDSHYLQEIEVPSQTHLNSTIQDSSESDLESINHLPQRGESNPESVFGNQRRFSWQSRTAITIAIVLIAIAIPVYFGFIRDRGTTSISKKPVPKPSPSVLEKSRSAPKEKSPSEAPSGLAVVPEVELKPDVSKPATKIVNAPPAMSPQDDEKPLIAKKGTTVVPASKIDLQIDWVRLSGIIGSRTSTELPWKGILADAATKQITNKKHLEIHTLPFSWVQGKIQSQSGDSGPDFVLDADSELQMTIRGIKPQNQAKQRDSKRASLQTVIDLNHSAGRVALSQLQAGDEIQFQDQRRSWSIQVKQDDTSVGFVQQNENRREIMLFSGEIQVVSNSDQRAISLKSDQMIVMRDHAFGAPVRVGGKQSWRTEPPKPLELSKSFIEQMNQSDDLLASLVAVPAGSTGGELLASTNLGFALDPVATVSQAAFSKSEIQRTAAITWLIAAKEDPATETIWRKINVACNANPAATSIRVWFKIAQGKVPGNQKILAELSAGLGAMQPLFVRQCAIHFLRQLTRQRFTEYDPNQPTPTAINSVRQKLRRAAGNARPKGNTRPQGNNKQRRN